MQSLWHASLQMLLPLCILLIFDIERHSVTAVAKCWFYRGLFLKILILSAIPLSITLPVLPSTNELTVLREKRQERIQPTEDSLLTTSVVNAKPNSPIAAKTTGSVSIKTLLFVVWVSGVSLIAWRTA